ncbi:hypothetical protein lerEdw1_021107 [Lerista edwardsae]|nr:hypothetical protein lerEdw1_021109 [Lerista edwardsae]KAJ6651297.1 hypothetical protein lerEdw1_021107 [Lerista edwardsae]
MTSRLVHLKRALLNLPPLPMSPQRRKERNLISMKAATTRSSLNLPALAYQTKLNSCDKAGDINEAFVKLSELHSKLPDFLKEILLRCACEDHRKEYVMSCFDTGTPAVELPQRVYSSPQPHHVPLMKRISSNKIANEHKSFGVYRRDAPLGTIVARWTPNSMSTQYDLQSVSQELAKFGEIDSMTAFGRQTVIVVFSDIRAACKAVSAFPPHGPDRGMRCFWHYLYASQYKIPTFRKKKNSKLKTVKSSTSRVSVH